MKKIITFIITFFIVVLMTSCSQVKAYSLNDAAGFKTSDVYEIFASESVYQSLTWPISEDAYSYLDCDYVQVNFDIDSEFFSWPPSEQQDDAYVLHIGVKNVSIYEESGPIFYISHSTKYMYFNGIDAVYRSKDSVPLEFIDLIKMKN